MEDFSEMIKNLEDFSEIIETSNKVVESLKSLKESSFKFNSKQQLLFTSLNPVLQIGHLLAFLWFCDCVLHQGQIQDLVKEGSDKLLPILSNCCCLTRKTMVKIFAFS